MLKNLRNKIKNNKGFTLVELIVVIVILIILAAIAIPVVSKYIADANQSKCTANARTAYLALSAIGADTVARGATIDITAANAKDKIKAYVTLPTNSTFSGLTFTADGAVEKMTYTEGDWKVEVTDGTFPAAGAATPAPIPPGL